MEQICFDVRTANAITTEDNMNTQTGTLRELVKDLADRLEASLHSNAPLRVVGFVGPPGAGKSTAAKALEKELHDRSRRDLPIFGGLLPMDGFHLSNAVLEDLGRRERKGAPDTFDVVGYLMMLDRARNGSLTVYAPGYDRELHEPIAARHEISPQGIVITEGNYLALPRDEWQMVRESIDILIYLEYPQDVLLRRLVNRQIEFGASRDQAAHWVRTVDAINIALVQTSRTRCDLIWDCTEDFSADGS